MITLGFCNLKGGVGKTTACQNIAAALARTGRRIAAIDMDPQSNLSAGFGLTPSPTDPQVFDLLSGGASWDSIVKHKEGVDVIPSSLNLVMAELNETGLFDNDNVLRDALKTISPDRYDYILIDSPPQLGIFTRNVLAACDKIIVPMDGGFYSLLGLKLLENSLSVLSDRLENNLEILGILMTNHNPRLSITRQVFDEVQKTFGDILFENYITQSVGLIEAASLGYSIFEYSPKSKAAEAYRDVTKELIKRVEGEEASFEVKKKKRGRKPKAKTEETPTPTPAPEPEPTPEEIKPIPEVVEAIQEPVPEIESNVAPEPVMTLPEPPAPMRTAGAYEEGIKQDLLDMLPDKGIWPQMLAPITDISRGEIDVRELREDFENCDKNRYTFYILNDDEPTLWPVMFPDQIVEPMRCVLKWDENGSAEVFF
ncbi:MAG: AAA family ATPase [Synergistaceae bacterium]|nr:AAA family ATPase [Synergistaceae bacterium]